AGGTVGRLSRAQPRPQSLRREQKPGRYREIVRDVSRKYFPGRADVAVRDERGPSGHVGCGDRMGKRFSVRLERAAWWRGERNPRAQRRARRVGKMSILAKDTRCGKIASLGHPDWDR